MKLLTLTSLLLAATASVLHATSVTFSATGGTGVTDLLGNELSGTTVELGYYQTSTFTAISGASTTTGNPLPGMFFNTSLFESNSLTTFQPAMRIFSTDGGSVIAYNTTWAFLGGDGTGLDTNTQTIDLNQVVSGGSLTANGVILATPGSQFNLGGPNHSTFGTPTLQLGVVPEPSSFALLAGVFGLAWVMVRRRA